MAIQVGGTQVISNSQGLTNISSIDSTTASAITAGGVGGTFPDLTGTTNSGTDSVTTTRNIFGIDGVTQTATANTVSSITFTIPTGWRPDLFNGGGAAGWRLDWFNTFQTNGAIIRMEVNATGGVNLNYGYLNHYGNSTTGGYSFNQSSMPLMSWGASNSVTGKRGLYGSIWWDGLISWSFQGAVSYPYSGGNLFMRSTFAGEMYSGYNLSSITLYTSSGNFGLFGGVLYPTAKFPSL